MEFGSWQVTNEGISWKGQGFNRFEIPADQLNATWKGNEEDEIFYEWILLATAEDWMTEDDLIDLNYAFVFAAAKFEVEFDYEIFDATMEEQFEQLDAEEDEDFDM
jgi:hypothetical protein